MSASVAQAPPPLLLSRAGRAGLVQLNRPGQLNALSLPMLREALQGLTQWQRRPAKEGGVSLVIVKGCVSRTPGRPDRPVFCSGGDVRSVADAARRGDTAGLREFFRVEFRLNYAVGLSAIEDTLARRQPLVALMDGVVMGGGAGVSINGSHRVATERTLFAMPEVAIGFFPDVGGGHFLNRLPGHLGACLALTGHRLAGWDVRACGLATHFVNSALLPQLEAALCHGGNWTDDLDAHSNVAAILSDFEARSSGLCDLGQWSLAPRLAEIDQHFGRDSVPEIMASLLRSTASSPSTSSSSSVSSSVRSSWAAAQLAAMRAASPTSLAVTLRHMRLCRSGGLSLADALRQEFRLVARLITGGGDFVEGVRARLDEKGRGGPPIWRPASVEEVTEADVAAHFAPLPPGEELTLSDDHDEDNRSRM